MVFTTYAQSGDSPTIPLTEVDEPPTELRDRWKVVEKMAMVTQYAFSGDYTGPYHSLQSKSWGSPHSLPIQSKPSRKVFRK